ncbi:hypothetical protein CHS0354_004617 [Potamilus streckersoni]|uniref:Uncharacterized protein n=1 Tax=Potamilus streckersoni TaxID=2493646 RepID=A0AAE0VQD1_9BIVA|nr:hypothetical protein CHS0354_004617 [Potamilus streckersoni]
MVHVNIGGGRDNIVRYNIFYNATAYAMQIDSRGTSHTFDSDLLPRLKNEVHVNIGGGRDNIVRYNIFYNATAYAMQIDGRGIHSTNNQELNRSLHVSILV